MNCELSKILLGVFVASAALVLATAWGWLVPLMVGVCLYCNEVNGYLEGLGL